MWVINKFSQVWPHVRRNIWKRQVVPLEWLVSLFPTVIEMVPTLLCSAMPPLASVGAQPQMARKFQILKSGASPAVSLSCKPLSWVMGCCLSCQRQWKKNYRIYSNNCHNSYYIFDASNVVLNQGYSQLPLRQTPLGPAVSVHLREMSIL